MVNFVVEPLSYMLAHGLPELSRECWEMVESNIQSEYRPHWRGYQEEEENDMLRFISMREGGNLIGYASVRFGFDPHDGGKKAVTLVDLYIKEEKRGNAFRFFRYIENLVYSLGAQRMIVSERLNLKREVGKFYELMGYYPKEMLWTKFLGLEGNA